MHDNKRDMVVKAASEVERLLSDRSAASGKALRANGERLPRQIQKSAALIQDTLNRSEHQPFLLDSQFKSVQKAQKQLARFSKKSDSTADTKRGARQWLSGLLVSYLVFLMLLAAWWYVATQI